VFTGSGYEFMYNLLEGGEQCNLINVSVYYKCHPAGLYNEPNNFEKLVDGYIILTEAIFDLDRCQVTTKLYDETFSTKINNNKSIPFYSDSNITKNLEPIVAPIVRPLTIFDPSNGDYFPNSPVGCISVYDAFKHLVSCMSDNLVDFDSNFFQFVYDNPPFVPKNYVVTNAEALRNNSFVHTQLIFDKLFTALNKKLKLGMGFEKQANGRPLLRIEQASYFFDLDQSILLLDQPDIELRYDTESLIAGVDFGSNPFFNAGDCDKGNSPCSFIQAPFFGFRNESFGILGTCNTSKMLNLRSDEVIFDTNIIEDIIRFNNEDFDLNMIIIYAFGNRAPVSTTFSAVQGDPLAAGDFVYNPTLVNEQVSGNWLQGYPNSLIQYIVGFDPALTPFNAQIIDSTQTWTIFPVPPNGAQYYYAEVGVPIKYLNQISDPNNLFDGEKYVVPYAGTYTFTARIALQLLASLPTSRVSRAIIRQYNASDVLIGTYNGAVASDSGLGNIRVNVTATFPCNAGDLIRVDLMEYYTDSSVYASLSQQILVYAVDGSTDLYSEFFGSGVPFGQTDLQPVDPNQIRNVLYKFKRPLSMNEIQTIISNTSSPMGLCRTEDVNKLINVYIKNINIESIIKQMATFDLRSNLLLQ
jgi:hypothetical protein